MKNLETLNNYLFDELEKLSNDEIVKDEEKFDKELKRSVAVSQVACQIIQNARVVLDAKRTARAFGDRLDTFYRLDYTEKKEQFKNSFKEYIDIERD